MTSPLHQLQKSRHFTSRNLSWEFWDYHLYTKSTKLCITWRFYIQKARHFAKRKTICITFLNTKFQRFCITQFLIEFLKLVEGGGHFYMQKYLQFVLRFYMHKQCTFCYILFTKSLTLCATVLYSKNNALCVMFVFLKWSYTNNT